jgi:UDP-N-acetylmuramate dehydrogenase
MRMCLINNLNKIEEFFEKNSQNINIKKNFSLADISYLKIGGIAKYYVEPKNLDVLKQLIKTASEEDIPYVVVGNCSNILFSDKDFDGIIISLKGLEQKIIIKDDFVEISGNVSVANFIFEVYNKGLGGAEFLSGIPGNVLSSVFLNAGSKFGCFSDILTDVVLITKQGKQILITKKNIKFSYRKADFNLNGILIKAGFLLKKSDKELIKKNIDKILVYKKSVQPLEKLSLGCVFKNPEGVSAGRLIESAGLKGFSVNDIVVSEKHANFFINKGAGKACDFYKLINIVKQKVLDKYNINLELEINLIGEF